MMSTIGEMRQLRECREENKRTIRTIRTKIKIKTKIGIKIKIYNLNHDLGLDLNLCPYCPCFRVYWQQLDFLQHFPSNSTSWP